MNSKTQYLISKDNGKLQMPYADYVSLLERMEEAERVMQVKSDVLAELQSYLDGATGSRIPESKHTAGRTEKREKADADTAGDTGPGKVSVEFSASEEEVSGAASPEDAPTGSSKQKSDREAPPIKKEIAAHFNAQDESGRLFNVFKQYYTCLNEACGGTVRVTMKDGVCSLLNYDEWEEFAYIDILKGELRFAVDPRYTDDLSKLSFCEVPRLLAARRKLVAIQLGDLNKTMLNVLARAFNEVGMTAG